MAVDNPWFWILMLTGAALVVAAVVLYVRGRGGSRDTPGVIGDHEFLMYLNETLVMEMFQYRGKVRALKRRVEQYTRESAEGRSEVKIRWFKLGAVRIRDGEERQTFETEERPITAIRTVVQELEKANAIVYADFRTGEVHAHRTFAENATGEANRARVLGKVEAWDEQSDVLKMWALAIFR